MANKRIDQLTAVSAAASTDLLPLRQTAVSETRKLTLAQLIVYILADSSVIAAIAAGSVTTEQIQDIVGAMLLDSSTIDFTYDDAGATITAIVKAASIGPTQLASTAVTPGTYGSATAIPVLTVDQQGRLTTATTAAASLPFQNLAQEYETPASSYTSWTLMVATTNNGVICFGGPTVGKFGKFDWSTFTWTEGACTGATAAAYTWAIYVPSVDLIWAGTVAGSATHTINPATMVATDISGASGVIANAIHNPISGLVYGYTSSSPIIKEMNATTGVIARSFNYATASSGYHGIGVNTTTGILYLIQQNTGSGPKWLEVPTVAFNAVSQSVACANAGTGVNNYRIAVDPVNGRCVWWAGSNTGVSYTIAGATSVDIKGRLTGGGGKICYDATNGYFYCIYLASLLFAARIDGSTIFLASKFVTGLASGLTGTSQAKDIIHDPVTDRIYVLTNAGSMIRLIP